MDTHRSETDAALLEALSAFERATRPGPEQPAPALPAAIGLLRGIAALVRFAVAVAIANDRSDPIHLEPRILRSS